MNKDMSNGEIVTKGSVGAGSSFLAWLLAHVQEINSLLQMGCLSLGFTISAVTLWKLLTKKRKRHEN
jgi:hypothetical protein